MAAYSQIPMKVFSNGGIGQPFGPQLESNPTSGVATVSPHGYFISDPVSGAQPSAWRYNGQDCVPGTPSDVGAYPSRASCLAASKKM